MEGSSGAAVEGLNPSCASLGEIIAIVTGALGRESGGTAGWGRDARGGGKTAVLVGGGRAAEGAASAAGAGGASSSGAAEGGAAAGGGLGAALAVCAGGGVTGSAAAAGTALAGGGGGAGISVPARSASALYWVWVPAAARESVTCFWSSGVVATFGLSGKVERSGVVPEEPALPVSSLRRPVGSSDAIVEQAPALIARASTTAKRKPRTAGRIAIFVMPSTPRPKVEASALPGANRNPGETPGPGSFPYTGLCRAFQASRTSKTMKSCNKSHSDPPHLGMRRRAGYHDERINGP